MRGGKKKRKGASKVPTFTTASKEGEFSLGARPFYFREWGWLKGSG